MIRVYDLNCVTDLELDGTRVLLICSPTMIRMSVNTGWRISCQAVLGMRGRCVYSGRNYSPFGLIWTAKSSGFAVTVISYAAFSTGSPASIHPCLPSGKCATFL
jgi:hypothetical protein